MYVLQTSDGKLQLIDFEYSGMGLQAFDLGNLFCETTYDYTEADSKKETVVHLMYTES